MNLDKVELLREVLTFLKRFEDKDVGIKTLEILLEQDPDIDKIINAIKERNAENSLN